MANKMLIDSSHPEETRVVVTRGNKVEEFDFEAASRRQLRGNIYLAKVTRVEPSLQAAFIEYGGNRHGFLAFSEIHPDYYQIPVADRQALIEAEETAEREAESEAERPRGRRRRSAGRRRREGDATVSASAEAEGAPSAPDGQGGDVGSDPAFVPDDFTAAELAHDDRADAFGEATAGAEGAPGEAASDEGEAAAVSAANADWSPIVADEALVAPAAMDDEGPLADDEAPRDDERTGSAEEPSAGGPDRADETDASDEDDDEEDEDDEGDDEEEDEDDVVEQVGGSDSFDEVPERPRASRRQYKIQEVIKRRQVLLVQVVKEERGNKGAALTTYLSLAGRYAVLMPNTGKGGGISRKITNAEDRKRLKEVVSELDVPDGMGVILRTAGANRTMPEIKRDFEYLMRLWESVRELTLKSSAAALVYEEGSLIKRAIRDLYGKEIDEVLVAGEDGFREARDFMKMILPTNEKVVKPYRDSQPLFVRHGVEAQLDAMFSNNVTLKSGGYLVINPTEALVSIDVNSGRSTREHNIEDTALRTNLEAAEEVARQLRLRDLAGLIVIDFIDMDEKRNDRTVEKKLKDCLKNDRARIQLGRISPFGLMEMSRQRIRTGVLESSSLPCPHCAGTGFVRSAQSVSLQVVRAVEEALLRSATHNLVVRTRTEVAFYILNQKRAHVRELELRFGVAVAVLADDGLGGTTTYALDRGEFATPPEKISTGVRVDTIMPFDEPEAVEAAAFEDEREGTPGEDASLEDAPRGDGKPADAEDAAETEDGERPTAEAPGDDQNGRRRRRRRRRGRGGDRPAGDETDGASDEERAELGGEGWPQGADEGAGERSAEPMAAFDETPTAAGTDDGVEFAGFDADERPHAALPDLFVTSDTDLAASSLLTQAPDLALVEAERAADPVPTAAEFAPPAPAAATPRRDEIVSEPSPEPEPEPVAVVLTPSDPDRPKRGGWWSKAKATVAGS